MIMTPCELLTLRQGLHLSQGELAAWLGVPQATVSRWEAGSRAIPSGVRTDLDPLLHAFMEMADAMTDQLDAIPDAALIVHTNDKSFWAAHPDSDGLPASVQRAAAFAVAAETRVVTGKNVPIIAAITDH